MVLQKKRLATAVEQKDAQKKFLWVILVIISSFCLFHFFPLNQYAIYPPCPIYTITHTYCPGCGSLRAVNGLVRGDFVALLKYNPILVVVIIPFIYYFFFLGILASMKICIPIFKLSSYDMYGIVGVIILYWIMRNLFPILQPQVA